MADAPHHILITGASSGLGAALALAYARAGRTLTLLGRDTQRLDAVAEGVQERGAAARVACVPVTDRAAMAAAIGEGDDAAPLDLVVANAGISSSDGANGAVDVLAVNVLGVWHTVEPALARMGSRGRGQLALMSSLAGFRGIAGAGPYCASKAAVRVLAESLRAEWRRRGVRVSAISPGFVDTPLTRRNRFPMPWLMTPEAGAARIVRGLARDEAHITFPWPLVLATRLYASLPQVVADRLLTRRSLEA